MAYLNSTVKIKFSVGNVRNSMLHDYATFYKGLTCFKKTSKTLGYMKVMVYAILSDGAQNHKRIT